MRARPALPLPRFPTSPPGLRTGCLPVRVSGARREVQGSDTHRALVRVRRYDAIHNLVRQDEITKEDENVLYDLIGRQDKALAGCYQVRSRNLIT